VKDRSKHDDWFQPSVPPAPPSEHPSSLPPARLAGDPLWSAVSGTLGGAIGTSAVALVGRWLQVPLALHVPSGQIALAVAGGAAVGAVFGRLTRRLVRVVPRVVFGAIAAAVVWLLLYAFVFGRFAPHLAHAISFEDSTIGAALYGAFTGAIPPIRTRGERGRRV
jgi:hypothetical protein